ncbi:hypothetical protein DPMN_107876 [Dreissena polymorpha]|uniref:Uncharacterized protein n=2 Tax=Dreissena polymorpha TaxID=45954 RepID=A0A9D4K7P8_DREPO|nr:hypothetical protein DPMN_107876 [Dreissena polymorpha]
MAEMVNLIKKGVKLRPMRERHIDDAPRHDTLHTPSEDHMKLLVESLNRISVFTRESSPDSDSDNGEFDD